MHSLFKFLSFFVVMVSIGANSLNSYRDSSIIDRFKNWVETHNIEATDDHHLARMFDNWLSNDKFIDETNSRNLTWTLGHNAYSGMNTDEFSEFMGFRANAELLVQNQKSGFLRGSVPTVEQSDVSNTESLPSSIDWRQKGVVSEIQNQQNCGSCWSFSATATLESASAIKYGKLSKLSEQELVSCAGLKYGNLGCNGGMYDSAWNYVKDVGGQCLESAYPYTSGNGDTGSCVKGCTPVSGTKVTSYVDVTPNSDSAMMTALNVCPISIAIEADARSFQMYTSGIYSDLQGCGNTLDHAVVLVGYNSDAGQDYYILRNSWATSWGENGYMRISKGSQNGKYGMCGLLMEGMYPIV